MALAVLAVPTLTPSEPPGPLYRLDRPHASATLACTMPKAMAKRNDVKKRRTRSPKPGSNTGGSGRRLPHLPMDTKQRDEYIARIAAGERHVGAMRSMSITPVVLVKTLAIDPKFEARINEARRMRAFLQADRAERITGHFFEDDGSNVLVEYESPEGKKRLLPAVDIVSKEEVGLRRNAAEHLRWEAERANPDSFGQKVDLDTSGKHGKTWADLALERPKG